MSNKKYTVDARPLASTLEGLFGTRKHAYDTLRLELVGMTMPSFYRIWREGRASLAEHQTLTAMLNRYWSDMPKDTPRAAAEYVPQYPDELIVVWRRNLNPPKTRGLSI